MHKGLAVFCLAFLLSASLASAHTPLVSYDLVLALGIWMTLAFYSSAGFSFRML